MYLKGKIKMSKALFINFMREKGVEPTERDLERFEFMAKSYVEDQAHSEMWEQSAKRIAEIDKLEDKYGYFNSVGQRAEMPHHIEEKLKHLHQEQSAFESDHA